VEFRQEQYLKSAEDAFIVINNKNVAFVVLHMFNIKLFLLLAFYPPTTPRGGLGVEAK
jgi:hypothetical protein